MFIFVTEKNPDAKHLDLLKSLPSENWGIRGS